MKKRMLCVGVGWLVIAGMFVAGRADAAERLPKRRVECNETITESLRVANNLDGCDDEGLIVGAPNITIDLNGHRISGTGGTDDFGVYNPGHAGVTIRNGAIEDFDAGVYVIAAARNRVQGIVATLNNDGILVEATTKSIVKGNTVTRNDFAGINLFNSSSNTVKRNTASRNGGDGILLVGSDLNTVVANTSTGSGDDGVDLATASDNRLERNRVTGNLDRGILLGDSERNVLAENVVKANESNAIELENGSDSNRLIENLVSGNSINGIVLDGSGQNKLKANKVGGNGAAGILLSSAPQNVLKGNAASKNTADGIWVISGAGSSLSGNSAHANGENGILSNTDQVTINDNKANENGFLNDNSPNGDDVGLGISAPAGTPGSGNVAKRNDDPDQCDPASLCA